jgi:hypothetical protein
VGETSRTCPVGNRAIYLIAIGRIIESVRAGRLPLGMYGAVSSSLGLAADFPPLAWMPGVMMWVALLAGGRIMRGVLGALLRP